MLAYDYPLLGAFWTIMWFFLWIAWIVILFRVLADIFRSRDLGGWSKGLWVFFVIVIPWLGVLVYVIARGDKMTEHAVQEARDRDAMFRSYVQDAASTTGSAADEIAKLAELHGQGAITDEEFAASKARLLA